MHNNSAPQTTICLNALEEDTCCELVITAYRHSKFKVQREKRLFSFVLWFLLNVLNEMCVSLLVILVNTLIL